VSGVAEKSKPKAEMVWVELAPVGGVDVLGDAPLLVAGIAAEFTLSEANELLALRNPHGAPICRIVTVQGASK
jgi:hypothetical protein